jgi:hypothetical protein
MPSWTTACCGPVGPGGVADGPRSAGHEHSHGVLSAQPWRETSSGSSRFTTDGACTRSVRAPKFDASTRRPGGSGIDPPGLGRPPRGTAALTGRAPPDLPRFSPSQDSSSEASPRSRRGLDRSGTRPRETPRIRRLSPAATPLTNQDTFVLIIPFGGYNFRAVGSSVRRPGLSQPGLFSD